LKKVNQSSALTYVYRHVRIKNEFSFVMAFLNEICCRVMKDGWFWKIHGNKKGYQILFA